MAKRGLSLAEMAAALGVSRQCVHAQLLKCGDLHTEQMVRRALRTHRERSRRQTRQAFEWIQHHSAGGRALAKFLRAAEEQGWVVHASRRRRPRINGARLAFHLPRRLRTSRPGQSGGTRYYHIQLTRPDWLHVVCLPTGRYVFYLPDMTRSRGSHYIPEHTAHAPQVWPEWSPITTRSTGKPVHRRHTHPAAPKWAA